MSKSPTKKQVAGFKKQATSLRATMALSTRNLACVKGKFAGQVIKNPRHGWVHHNWFTRSQKTKMAKFLFAQAKANKYPTYVIGTNTFQLVGGLSKTAQAKLKQVGAW